MSEQSQTLWRSQSTRLYFVASEGGPLAYLVGGLLLPEVRDAWGSVAALGAWFRRVYHSELCLSTDPVGELRVMCLTSLVLRQRVDVSAAETYEVNVVKPWFQALRRESAMMMLLAMRTTEARALSAMGLEVRQVEGFRLVTQRVPEDRLIAGVSLLVSDRW